MPGPLYPLQPVFARGELSPRLFSRVDIDHYKMGLAECVNWLVMKQGGLRRRPGTEWITWARYPHVKCRLVRFVFSTLQAYVLEFGHGYIRFYANGGIVNSGGTPIELGTPWTADDIWKLQFAQSADVLYIAHPDFQQMMLSRFSGSNFTLVPYTGFDGPYLPENTTGTSMIPSGTAGIIQVAANGVTGINANAGFHSTDVGRWLSLKYSNKWYGIRITAVLDAITVQGDVVGHIDDKGTQVFIPDGASWTAGWRMGAWSPVTGYPGCVAFYQQRLVWARSDTQPQTIWMSKAGILDNFAQTVPMQDDDALTLTILAGEVNAISWIVEGQDLLVGTNGAMRTVGPADAGKNFGPTNFQQKRQSTFGSLDIQPVQVAEVAIYPSYYGLSLREFLFNFQVNGYVSPELTILSEHMLRSGIKQMAYAQDKDGIIWNVMGNGELVGITYDRDQQIVACQRHRIAGHVVGVPSPGEPAPGEQTHVVNNPDTPWGMVESVTTIPGADRSEVWLSVRRTINGVDTRHIERMTITFEAQPKEDAVFVNSSFTFASGTPFHLVTGVTWLANQTVAILADGAVLPEVQISASGVLTLPGGLPPPGARWPTRLPRSQLCFTGKDLANGAGPAGRHRVGAAQEHRVGKYRRDGDRLS